MTKYINKLTGAELDYDRVHGEFEESLVWDGETDPEDFLIDSYEDYFEDWLEEHGIEEIEVPDLVKPKKATKRKNKKNGPSDSELIASLIEMVREFYAHPYMNVRNEPVTQDEYIHVEIFDKVSKKPEIAEKIITLYGSKEDQFNYWYGEERVFDLIEGSICATNLIIAEAMG